MLMTITTTMLKFIKKVLEKSVSLRFLNEFFDKFSLNEMNSKGGIQLYFFSFIPWSGFLHNKLSNTILGQRTTTY